MALLNPLFPGGYSSLCSMFYKVVLKLIYVFLATAVVPDNVHIMSISMIKANGFRFTYLWKKRHLQQMVLDHVCANIFSSLPICSPIEGK